MKTSLPAGCSELLPDTMLSFTEITMSLLEIFIKSKNSFIGRDLKIFCQGVPNSLSWAGSLPLDQFTQSPSSLIFNASRDRASSTTSLGKLCQFFITHSKQFIPNVLPKLLSFSLSTLPLVLPQHTLAKYPSSAFLYLSSGPAHCFMGFQDLLFSRLRSYSLSFHGRGIPAL